MAALMRCNWKTGFIASSFFFLLLGVLLRVYQLDVWPSPAGDELNWTMLGLDLSEGRQWQLDSDASFIPRTFGWLIAAAFWLLPPSFWSARLVAFTGMILGVSIILLVSVKKEALIFGMVIAGFLVWHPWSVCWGRTVSVPYSLSLVLAVLGPLAWLIATDLPNSRRRTWAMIGAGQILVLGLHFSPLAGIPLVACGLWLIFPRRNLLDTPASWLVVILILLHGIPLVLLALSVARGMEALTSGDPFWVRLTRYVLVSIDILNGEATVRHFTSTVNADGILWIMRWGTIIVAAAACQNLISVRRANSERASLLSFGVLYFLVSLIGLPFLLSGGRDWSLPAVHHNRYGFVLLAPWTICFAALAQRSTKWALLTMLWLVVFAVIPSSRIWWAMTHASGPDRGEFALTGGGWRGWRSVIGPSGRLQALPDALLHSVRAEAQHEPITLVLTDWFGMRAVSFPLRLAGDERIRLDFTTKANGHILEPGSRVILVVYSDAIFAAEFQPASVVGQNARARGDFRNWLSKARLHQTLVQPDETPLLELWDGRVPSLPQ